MVVIDIVYLTRKFRSIGTYAWSVGKARESAAFLQYRVDFRISDILGNPVKCRRGEHEIIGVFLKHYILEFTRDDAEPVIVFESFLKHLRKVLTVFNSSQFAAGLKYRKRGLTGSAAHFDNAAFFADTYVIED